MVTILSVQIVMVLSMVKLNKIIALSVLVEIQGWKHVIMIVQVIGVGVQRWISVVYVMEIIPLAQTVIT